MAVNTPLSAKKHTDRLAETLTSHGSPFVRFSDWTKAGIGARPNRAAAPSKVKGVIIHHSTGLAKNDGLADVRMVERGATSRKRSDGRPLFSMVPYSFLVPMTGEVFEGRGFAYGNAANKTGKVKKWGNHNTYSICLPGMYHPPANQTPTDRQILAVRKLIYGLSKLTGRKLTVLGHRDMSWTACPGDVLYNYLGTIREPYSPKKTQKEPELGLDQAIVKQIQSNELSMVAAVHGSAEQRLAAAYVLGVTDGSNPDGAATRLDVMTMVARAEVRMRERMDAK